MRVYKCDRCGNHYEFKTDGLRLATCNIFDVVLKYIDLCPNCKKEFERWMRGDKTDEHIRTEIEEK